VETFLKGLFQEAFILFYLYVNVQGTSCLTWRSLVGNIWLTHQMAFGACSYEQLLRYSPVFALILLTVLAE
jgi:hypothetical protein